jgi:lipoprotein-releasing system ATP-binding protein
VAETLLHAESLGKTYGTAVKTVALQGVSFDLRGGEFASIIGQSGSGKSTLLNLIGLLDTPTTGRVVLNGHDTAAADRKQRAALRNDFIGFVFQFHYLLPEFSVLENVLMPGRIAGVGLADLRPRAEEVLQLLGLDGLEAKGANDLSGGQKQRVAIARALMNRPALVLADEPTGNLDTVNTKAVYELFRELNRELGTAFMIVTHDRSVAQQTDRILEIRDGTLLQDVRNSYVDRRPEEGPDEEPAEQARPADAAGEPSDPASEQAAASGEARPAAAGTPAPPV